MTALIVLLFSIYFLFVVVMLIGLNRSARQCSLTPLRYEPFVSVVIAARNEGSRIGLMMKDILDQSYRHFELIIVDDHSMDNTAEVVSQFTQGNPTITLLTNHNQGKKEALTLGIQRAKGTIIVTTDADCRIPITWLQAILTFFDRSETQLVFGGVRIMASSFFSSLQAHEFMSLIGTSAASAAFGTPTMCNGANLAFRKKAFETVKGYTDNMLIPSGDDEFLMQKIALRYPDSVRFAWHPQAVVATLPAVNLSEFINQRIRWAGKWRHSLSATTKMLAVFIFSFHVAVLVLPVAIFAGYISLSLGIFLGLSKVFFEAIFLRKISTFLSVRWRWSDFFILQLLYSLYAVSIGLMSNFSTFHWKDRKLKSFTVSTLKK